MLTFDAVTIAQGVFRLSADFTIPQGVTAVIGPSGGGKSTLLATIAGFIAAETGRISWEKIPLTDEPPGRRPVSMLFQDNNLFPHMTVAQNVGLGIRPVLRLTGAEQQVVADTLAKVGLAGFEGRKPADLSGGQQSRTALARVLVSDRPIVLLDEPFAALGPALKDEMLGLVVRTLAEVGKTVVMVTHDPEDAKRIADHVVLVADGMAHPPIASDEIFRNPPEALKAYLG
jgi:thiamine transport system ATP-binding protein